MDIKEIRKDAGFKTQKEFADYVGVSHRTIQRWEADEQGLADYIKELILYKLKSEGLLKQE